jgi:diaminohydroxyphosphoribosylaminopyrimidine deaminase/5-amino-6-(5-phosphoribosylamino)uracil reductase
MSGQSQSQTDAMWMRRCIELARKAEGRTAPNPMVGAVVLRGGEVIGEGLHLRAGEAHAEPDALEKATGDTRGATLYVNLEPCCHHGRTAPCTDAILRSGIARVVVGMVDPNPIVAGKGIGLLKAAGVVVDVGVEERACRELNAGYLKAMYRGLPRVWLKVASTMDGRIADANGRSQWITGKESREVVHQLRNRMDAILVGAGTLLADDPALTTRCGDGRDALPVVLDSQLRCPADAKIFQSSRRPLIFCAEGAPERELAADIVRVASTNQGLDLKVVLKELVSRGVHELLVEGGGTVHRSFLDKQLADRLLLFMAPKVLAGGAGFVGGAPLALDQGFGFRLMSTQKIGPDLLLDLEVHHVHRTR